jgi:hypothetical protein
LVAASQYTCLVTTDAAYEQFSELDVEVIGEHSG